MLKYLVGTELVRRKRDSQTSINAGTVVAHHPDGQNYLVEVTEEGVSSLREGGIYKMDRNLVDESLPLYVPKRTLVPEVGDRYKWPKSGSIRTIKAVVDGSGWGLNEEDYPNSTLVIGTYRSAYSGDALLDLFSLNDIKDMVKVEY